MVAASLTAIMAVMVLTLAHQPPWAGFYALFLAPLHSRSGIMDVLTKAAPLALMGAGLAVAYRARVWNIGAPGQYTIGAILGSAPIIVHPTAHGSSWIFLMVLLGILGGALYGLIPALLKNVFHANEILTSLMLNYVALYLLRDLTFGPWRDPNGYGFPGSITFPTSGTLPAIVNGGALDVGVIIAFLVPLVLFILLRYSLFGFGLRVAAHPLALRYGGWHYARTVVLTFLISGACAGLAGILQVAGPIGSLRPNIYAEIGFSAIIVAYLGQLNPLGTLPAALLVGLFTVGATHAQVTLGLPAALAALLQGLLLLILLACNVLVRYEWVGRSA